MTLTIDCITKQFDYIGMTPTNFCDLVMTIADTVGAPPESILRGRDHLVPNSWRDLPAADPMDKALVITKSYTAAGFSKSHLNGLCCTNYMRGFML